MVSHPLAVTIMPLSRYGLIQTKPNKMEEIRRGYLIPSWSGNLKAIEYNHLWYTLHRT
jgi:hypothetical protein